MNKCFSWAGLLAAHLVETEQNVVLVGELGWQLYLDLFIELRLPAENGSGGDRLSKCARDLSTRTCCGREWDTTPHGGTRENKTFHIWLDMHLLSLPQP